MGSSASPPGRDRVLQGLLLASVAVPALALAWGRVDGDVAFILYREPKLIAAAVCLWLLLAALAWRRPEVLSPEELTATLRRPGVALGSAFLAWLAITGWWVEVPSNYFYELSQYALLFSTLVALLTWTRRDGAVPRRVLLGLLASLGAVTAVGIVQLAGALPGLVPIDPEIGARHPSLMGYKNPAALAVGGQALLLLWAISSRDAGLRAGWRIAGACLLALELVYLGSLGSRTAYLATAAAVLYLLGLGLAGRRAGRRRAPLWALAFLAAVAITVAANPAMRAKMSSMAGFVRSPGSYLKSDRGTYLLNTLQMVRHHPLGVGLGDWQTHYPVYRLHRRELAFDDVYQVRRAHSDHVQVLGEAGWPGAVLWAAWLVVLIGAPARTYLRTGAPWPLFTSAQLVFLAAAMSTDYLLEVPYNKLQFFLVAYLALASTAPPRERPAALRPARWKLAAVMVTAGAVLAISYHSSLARKLHLSATFTAIHRRTVEEIRRADRVGRTGTAARVPASSLARVLLLGHRFDRLPGFYKTLHRDYLVLGHAAHLAGRPDLASDLMRRSLDYHPYYPRALHWMSRLAADPLEARRWRRAYDHVMSEATAGFEEEYPPRDRPGE